MAEWKGLDAALARMAKLPDEVKQAVEAQLDVEADALVAAIRSATPVRTGALRGSIQALPGKRPLSRTIVMGGQATTVKVRKGVADRDFERAKAKQNNTGEFDYSRAVEFGYHTEDGREVRGHAMFFGTYRARRKALRRRLAAAARKPLKTLFPS